MHYFLGLYVNGWPLTSAVVQVHDRKGSIFSIYIGTYFKIILRNTLALNQQFCLFLQVKSSMIQLQPLKLFSLLEKHNGFNRSQNKLAVTVELTSAYARQNLKGLLKVF